MSAIRQPRRALSALVLFASLVFAPSADAGEAYYLLVFGSQRVPADPRYSHSFATFVRTSWPDCDAAPQVRVESFTISWLPATLEVQLLRLKPECGVNLSLGSTLNYVLGNEERVSMWGPYQITPDFYARASRRYAQVQEGRLLYKAVDTGFDSNRVTNCIHALSAIGEGRRLLAASTSWGETASYMIVRRFRQDIIDPDTRHAWLIAPLGLDAYPIIYRDLGRPRSGAVFGPLYRLFGGEKNLFASFGM